MPHLKIIVSAIVGDHVYETGDLIEDAPDALAESLILDGNAELYDPNQDGDAVKVAAAVQEAEDDAAKTQAANLKKAIAAARRAAGTEKADAVEKAIAAAFTTKESAGS